MPAPTLTDVELSSFTTPATADGGSRSTPALTWNAGDLIVVMGVIEDTDGGGGNRDLDIPTATGLTFSAIGSPQQTNAHCWVHAWSATAGSSGSSAVTAVYVDSVLSFSASFGIIAWAWGNHAGLGNSTKGDPGTTPTVNLTVSADSAVCLAAGDFTASAAGRTPATGSGTATERLDTQVAGAYTPWAGDWVGTSAGTFAFGVDTGTSRLWTMAAVEVLGTAGAASGPTPPLWSYRSPTLRR